MEPNKHYEYETHHHPLHHEIHVHPQHVVHSNFIHHSQQQQSTALVTVAPPQQHQLPSHPYQSKGNASNITSSLSYHDTHLAGVERSRGAIYVMSACGSVGKGGGAAASVMPPMGAAASASGGDPHLQYYTSNSELTVGKSSTEPTSSNICWQYKKAQKTTPTGAVPPPTPLARKKNSALCNTMQWPSENKQQHQAHHLLHQHKQQSCYGYTKSLTPSHLSALGSSGNGSGQLFFEHNITYTTVVPTAKGLEYAPAARSTSMSQQLVTCPERYEPLDHVVNPTNAPLGTSEQQPSPNYARKCPQHYDPPTRLHSAAVPPLAIDHQVQQHHLEQQHQSLYMPPNFQNTMNNAIEKYVRESGPSQSLDLRRSGSNGSHSTVSFYSKGGLNSNAYAKLEPETPARPSLYHNPFNPTAMPLSLSDKEQQQSAAIVISSSDSAPTAPQVFPTKYVKLLQQQQQLAAPAQTTPQLLQSPTAFQERSSSITADCHALYHHQSTQSPVAAPVASPTFAQQLYDHTPTPTSVTASTSNYSTLQVYPHGADIRFQPATSVPVLSPALKKANQPAKPNYRALINDMLKRNTTSEEELNLQIIKKTLNMESPGSLVALLPTTSRQQLLVTHLAAPPPMPAQVIQTQMTRPLPVTLPTPHHANSPLDLSMRTVKQTADSTDYRYQRIIAEDKATEQHKIRTGTGPSLSLPRLDITPNFARSNNSSKTFSRTATSTAVMRQVPAGTGAASIALSAPQDTTPMLIKVAHQLRPSVLETNPFAKRPQLSPETIVKHINMAPDSITSSSTTTTIKGSAHNSSNPNYLGRKRHLQEYNQATAAAAAAEAAEKQTRTEAPQPMGDAAVTPVPIIGNNEQVLVAERLNIYATSLKQGYNISYSQRKQEFVVRPKTEARIRTKAELKGFIFTPPALESESITTDATKIPAVLVSSEPVSTKSASVDELTNGLHSSQPTNHMQIKVEPTSTLELNQELELDASSSNLNSNNLIDWGSTCNNLVKQLLMPVRSTPSIQLASLAKESVSTLALSSPLMSSRIKLELSEDDLPVARMLNRRQLQVDAESAATTTTQVTNTTTTNGIGLCGAQKKLSKTEREKKRIVQEQRIAARLAPAAGQSSSSESDTTELHKRNTARQKKPLMRKGRGKMRLVEEIKEHIKQRKRQNCDDEQDQDGGTTSTESKNFISVKKTRLATVNENIVEYTRGKCKTKKGKKQKGEMEQEQEENKSNSRSCTRDEKQQQHQKQHDDVKNNQMEKQNGMKVRTNVGQIKRKATSQVTKLRASSQAKNRISHNTMTRSKRKKELELQLANSKVLRNEKIIRNSTTKIKRKYVRKLVPDGKKELMSTRLRNKRSLAVDLSQLKGRKVQVKSEVSSTNNSSKKNHKTNKSPHQQLILEEYRYKLALKIPQRLISMNKLQKLPQIAASLPDLERSRDFNQELTCFKTNCSRKPRAKQQEQKYQPLKQEEQQQQKATPKSIIDVLHRRVTCNSSGQPGGKSKASNQSFNCSTSLHNYSETSQTSASNSMCELQAQEADHSLVDSTSKRHFSIFDTKVLQSKTRTESKLQQRREIIREIFVGTDRPASAPPECAQNHAGSALSYQQYEDFLEQMNRIVTANNNKLARHITTHDETQNCGKTDPFNTTAVPVITTHCPNKRKYLRRKGSSGFDYIRKKKRQTQHQSTSAGPTINIAAIKPSSEQSSPLLNTAVEWLPTAADFVAGDERIDDTDSTIAGINSHLPIKIKTDMDVCREIQKWVLNKGVGQSTMHKAARQGLIDVVVYCLDRMGMNPDQKDNAGYTPLHEACTQGWLEIARILLQFGANHSEAAQSGIRPLHGAIENDHDEVVRLLLSYGADPLLATYSGHTPLMLASSKLMCSLLRSHLSDAQGAAADIKPMRFQGPWEIFNQKENGFDIFDGVPETACDMSRALCRQKRWQKIYLGDIKNLARPKTDGKNRKNNCTNGTLQKKEDSNESTKQIGVICGETETTTLFKKEPCTELEDKNNNKDNDFTVEQKLISVVNDKNELKREPQDDGGNTIKYNEINEHDDDSDVVETFSDELNSDIFKFEEADVPLPPLYLLKDEGSDKWVLLNDLCNLLKVKSKDTLLNKICPNTNMLATTQKQLLREFKIDDFLEQATCLQLLCAGEKLNMLSSSKVMLIRYNENVKNLLGVKTILMKF